MLGSIFRRASEMKPIVIGCLGIFLWGVLLLPGMVSAYQASAKPNIVMIVSDDQAWTDYSFMGHETIKTPSLDRLARQSVLFRRGYVPTSLCRPSLMTMITGQYAHRHGVTGNDPSPRNYRKGTESFAASRAKLIAFVDQTKTLPKTTGAAWLPEFSEW